MSGDLEALAHVAIIHISEWSANGVAGLPLVGTVRFNRLEGGFGGRRKEFQIMFEPTDATGDKVMTDVSAELSNIDEPGTDADSKPYIGYPAYGEKVASATLEVRGGGNADRNVVAVIPGTDTALSTRMQMDGHGWFKVVFLKALVAGETLFQILQYKQMPSSHMRSDIWSVWYMPAPNLTEPSNGASVIRRPIFKAKGAAPGAIMRMYQYGNGNIVYAEGVVDPYGDVTAVTTRDLPLGQVRMIGRYSRSGYDSAWSNDIILQTQ